MDWKEEHITRHTGKRYNGLKNQGATCYLNSVLQCLFMTEEFRDEIENFEPDTQNSDETVLRSADLVQELQKLFTKLKEADGTTKGITRSLGIIDVYEQQDAVEYYQKTLKAIGTQASKVFEGKMSNNTKCQNGHIFQEKLSFLTIPLSIKNKYETYNVMEEFEAYSAQKTLDEDDWMYCEHCTQKNETKTWNQIEEFPAVLTLYLKRFHFDFNINGLVKNDCPVSIPLQLKNNIYELYAVINHMGGHNGGHYNAVIKSFEDDEWYLFDDMFVRKVLKEDLEKFSSMSQHAYLLMYRKKTSREQESSFQLQRTTLSPQCNFDKIAEPERYDRFTHSNGDGDGRAHPLESTHPRGYEDERLHVHQGDTNVPFVKCSDQCEPLDIYTSVKAPVQKQFEKEGNNNTSLINKQSQENIKVIQENRDYIKCLADILLCTATQNLLPNGHRETVVSDNKRNLISHQIQNDMLDILAEMVRSTIIKEVKESQVFALMADLTENVNRIEHIYLVLRYYYRGAVKESFLHVEASDHLNAAGLADKIIHVLERYGLEYRQNLVGQSYSGMSGKKNGVQDYIKNGAKQAFYVQSNAHCLNLVLVDTVKVIPEVKCFFSLVQKLCMFMSESYVHTKWLNMQKQTYNEEPRELQMQCDARYACQHKAWHTILDRLPATICVLEEIDQEKTGDRSVEARGLLPQIDLQFIGLLVMLTELFDKVQNILHSPNDDVSLAVKSAEALEQTLKKCRDETYFEELWKQVLHIAEQCGIDTESEFIRKKMQKKRQAGQIGGHSEQNKHTFYTGIFNPVIDGMLTEINSWLSKLNCELMKGIQALNPTNAAFCDEEALLFFASKYECNVEDLKHELHVLKRTLERKIQAGIEKPSSIVGLTKFIEDHEVFSELFRLCKIAAIIPVSTVAYEKSFSVLKLVKTYLRSTMDFDRLNTLGFLKVESKRANALDLDEVVDQFVLTHRNHTV